MAGHLQSCIHITSRALETKKQKYNIPGIFFKVVRLIVESRNMCQVLLFQNIMLRIKTPLCTPHNILWIVFFYEENTLT